MIDVIAGSGVRSPLFLDGWLAFNRYKWGGVPLVIRVPAVCPEGVGLEAVCYLNKHGKITMPGLNLYLPVAFETSGSLNSSDYDQQFALAARLAWGMRTQGLHGTIRLSPELTDIRPWQQAGFLASVGYTSFVEFPFNLQTADKSRSRAVRKAEKAGYSCKRTTDMAHVLVCLRGTQQRQGITHGHLTEAELEQARALMGDEAFRAYICYAPNGEPAATRVDLHAPGAKAIHWIAGTALDHLQSGATQLLISYVLQDIEAAGGSGYDFVGADLPGLAGEKMLWGGSLVPYYTIQALNLRSLAKWAREKHRFMRKGRSADDGSDRRADEGDGALAALS